MAKIVYCLLHICGVGWIGTHAPYTRQEKESHHDAWHDTENQCSVNITPLMNITAVMLWSVVNVRKFRTTENVDTFAIFK